MKTTRLLKSTIQIVLMVVCSIIISTSLFPWEAMASSAYLDSRSCGANITYTLSSEGILTISGNGAIKDYYNSSTFSNTGGVAYNYRDKVKSVVIQQGVTYIGQCAFYQYQNISSVSLPTTLKRIGFSAFDGCVGLTSIDFPNGLEVIENHAFYGCKNLSRVSLPNTLERLEYRVFYNCISLKNIEIPNKITEISTGLFEGCKSLQNISLPNGLTSIGGSSFQGCSSLKNISIPDGVTNIGSAAFQGCVDLKSINIPSGVTIIDSGTFYGCHNLMSITLPKTIKGIEKTNFNNTSQLTDIWYGGSKSEWEKITIGEYNNFLTHANIHYEVQASSYTITFNANGGTNVPLQQVKEQNVPLTLSSQKPLKDFVLQYDANGGKVTTVSKNVPCTFVNWNTEINGEGTSYVVGGSYTDNADVTLYAQWENPKAGTLVTPSREGYVFVGWYTSASGGIQIDESTIINDNTTIYAHWSNGVDPYNLGDETYSFSNFGDSDSLGGHCFGMSITSAGYHNGLLDITRIGGDKGTPLYRFRRTQTVVQPICYYQGIQGRYSQRATVAGGNWYLTGHYNISSDWQQVVNYVRDHKYDDTGILQIGYRKELQGGHAVNFLRYENINGQDRIYAYDNNYPDEETYFYKDTSGVHQAPRNTFAGIIDCISLRDVRVYLNNVGDFDVTRVLYMLKSDAEVQGYPYTYMEGSLSDEEYVMYEIPSGQDSVIIIPKRDDAAFLYMGKEYRFGSITNETRGEFMLSSQQENAVTNNDASFRVFDADPSIPIVTIDKTRLLLSVGESDKLTAKMIPDTSANKTIIWETNDSSIAIVEDGVVTAVSAGDTFIIATTADGSSTACCMITVTEELQTISFIDVPLSSYYYDAINWAISNGITSGVGEGMFGVNQTLTRAQAVTFLYSYVGKPAYDVEASFKDVIVEWQKPGINWAAKEGITSGTSKNTFEPDKPVTRGQAMAFLKKVSGDASSGSSMFKDVPFGSMFYNQVSWGVNNSITVGIGNNMFGVDIPITRQDFIVMLYKMDSIK